MIKEKSIKQVSDLSSLGMFYLDSVIDTERSINDAQKRMWKALKLEPKSPSGFVRAGLQRLHQFLNNTFSHLLRHI
jgi:hypothetical protein